MKVRFLSLLFLVFILMVGWWSCKKLLKNQDQFVTFGLNVKVSLDHYPALNEEAKLNVQFSFKDWYIDSLMREGIHSVKSEGVFSVQENNKDVYDAFSPKSGEWIWSDFVGINDTTNFEFKVKPLRVGKFTVGAGVGPVPVWFRALNPQEKQKLGYAFGSNSLIICVEKDTGYGCGP